MSGVKKASFLAFAALALTVVLFNLGPVVVAGLFSYMILDITRRRLLSRAPRFISRWLSVAIFVLVAVGASWLFTLFLKQALSRLPIILSSVIPMIDDFAARHGVDLPFENLHELRLMILDALKENVRAVTRASGLLTRGFFHILVAIFIAVTCFLADDIPNPGKTLFDAFRGELLARMRLFLAGFEKLLGAQVIISLVNTAVTTIFLYFIGMPFVIFLSLATFIFGVLPIVGNVMSNTIIVGTALMLSPQHSILTLAFLILIHKGEYILNSRIVGSSLKTPMWLMLLGILLGEAVMGVPGIILAPVLLHYIRAEMQDIALKNA